MSHFREDFNKAVEASIPVFKLVGRVLAGVFVVVLWINLNILLCDSAGAILALWTITAVCMIVAIQYHRVVFQREQDEKREAIYAKRDAEWQAKYGQPYPRI